MCARERSAGKKVAANPCLKIGTRTTSGRVDRRSPRADVPRYDRLWRRTNFRLSSNLPRSPMEDCMNDLCPIPWHLFDGTISAAIDVFCCCNCNGTTACCARCKKRREYRLNLTQTVDVDDITRATHNSAKERQRRCRSRAISLSEQQPLLEGSFRRASFGVPRRKKAGLNAIRGSLPAGKPAAVRIGFI